MESVVKMNNIHKNFKKFSLEVEKLEIPKGFATALIGENGAGKSTLMNILAGVRLDYKGQIDYFNGEKSDKVIREKIGYTSASNYFMPHWKLDDISKVSEILFDGFEKKRFKSLCDELGIGDTDKKVSDMSDGMRMKATLANVFARETGLLVLDEPASPLDPLMREKLCDMIRRYLAEGNGEKSVFFSTHNIADMENVTDYCVIMASGKVVEQGIVEELKEKYVVLKGEPIDAKKAEEWMISFKNNDYGFEGLCMSEDLNKFAGMDVAIERPTLSQISVAVMGQHSGLK